MGCCAKTLLASLIRRTPYDVVRRQPRRKNASASLFIALLQIYSPTKTQCPWMMRPRRPCRVRTAPDFCLDSVRFPRFRS